MRREVRVAGVLASSAALVASAVLAAGACVGEDPEASLPKPDSDVDAPVPDAGADAPSDARCNPTAPFDKIEPITALSTSAEELGARLTADELEIYFTSLRPSPDGKIGRKIWVASRASKTEAFSNVRYLGTLASSGNDRDPTLVGDGLTLVYSAEYVSGESDLFIAFRANRQADFQDAAKVSSLSDPDVRELTPYVTPNGGAVYFARANRLDSGAGPEPYRLYVAQAVGRDFRDAGPLDGLESPPSSAIYPVVTRDETRIFFSSDRDGGGAPWSIYIATRAAREAPFGAPSPVSELNTTGTKNYPSWISEDGCVLYFSRDGELLRATRGQ